jgi:iron complex transport system ATP-binding protein
MVADTVAVMHNGGLVGYGRPEEVITEETLSRIYGIPVKLRPDPDFGQRCAPVLPG